MSHISPTFTRRSLLAGGAAASLGFTRGAYAADGQIRIGVMGDLSGYSMEIGGPGAVLATRMAAKNQAAKQAAN